MDYSARVLTSIQLPRAWIAADGSLDTPAGCALGTMIARTEHLLPRTLCVFITGSTMSIYLQQYLVEYRVCLPLLLHLPAYMFSGSVYCCLRNPTMQLYANNESDCNATAVKINSYPGYNGPTIECVSTVCGAVCGGWLERGVGGCVLVLQCADISVCVLCVCLFVCHVRI